MEQLPKASNSGLAIAPLHEGSVDPWMGKTIVTLIRKSTDHIVYLDEKLDIQWWWTTEKTRLIDLNVVQANVSRLTCASEFLLTDNDDLRVAPIKQTRAWDTLRKILFREELTRENLVTLKRKEAFETARGIRAMIAESIATALEGGTRAECERILSMAEQQIVIQKDQLCRSYFFWQFAFAIFLCAAIVASISWIEEHLGANALTILHVSQVALAGAFGAFVSAMTRTTQLNLEPQSGRKGLRTEAFSRALIGAGAAILVYFAFDGGIILKGALASDAAAKQAITLFLCLAAGLSERVLPNLVVRAESLLDGKQQQRNNSTNNGSRKSKTSQ